MGVVVVSLIAILAGVEECYCHFKDRHLKKLSTCSRKIVNISTIDNKQILLILLYVAYKIAQRNVKGIFLFFFLALQLVLPPFNKLSLLFIVFKSLFRALGGVLTVW